MICLNDARRLFRNPSAAPCAPCLSESKRNLLSEVLASVAAHLKKERDLEEEFQEIERIKLTKVVADPEAARIARAAYHRAWRAKKKEERLSK